MPRASRRRLRRLIKLGSVLVLLFAVAPQVLYLGHPLAGNGDDTVAQGMPTGHKHHEQAAAEHANHCHVGPKGCAASDGAVHIASASATIHFVSHGGTMSAIDSAQPLRTFALWQRPEKPPQPV